LSQEFFETINELVKIKTDLKQMELKKELKVDQKIYRKLSDIESILSRMECHSRENLKLMRFQGKIIYHIIKRKGDGNYSDKDLDTWWAEFCRIRD